MVATVNSWLIYIIAGVLLVATIILSIQLGISVEQNRLLESSNAQLLQDNNLLITDNTNLQLELAMQNTTITELENAKLKALKDFNYELNVIRDDYKKKLEHYQLVLEQDNSCEAQLNIVAQSQQEFCSEK